MEGRINVVGSEGEEVKLFGGGRSDPDICNGDSGLDSAIKIQRLIAAAYECRNATDPDFPVMFKAKRRQNKIIRRDMPGISPDLEDCTTRLYPGYSRMLSASNVMHVSSLLERKSSQ